MYIDKGALEIREKYLVELKERIEEEMKSMPKGKLYICGTEDKTQYYHKLEGKGNPAKYLKKHELPLVKKLAQKDYNLLVLKAIENELKEIAGIKKRNEKLKVEGIFNNLHSVRQNIVVPVFEPDEVFIARWQAVEYEGKSIRDDVPEIITKRGERVRSKSEMIIADTLDREGIPYRYEHPVYLNGALGQSSNNYNASQNRLTQNAAVQTVYPDFTVLNVRNRKEILWEHLGMMDDGEYAEKAARKIQLYEQNGYMLGRDLILTFESKKYPLNQQIVSKKIAQYLK